MAKDAPRTTTPIHIEGLAILICGLALIGVGLIGFPASPAVGSSSGTLPAQRLSNDLAAFAQGNGYPVGRPRIRRLDPDSAGRLDLGNGASTAIGGLSLKDRTILLSPDALRAARKARVGNGVRIASFQLVKLIIHEQLHQVTWSRRSEWYAVGSAERNRDEGLTEALAWDLARVWCSRGATICTGKRQVVPAYISFVARMRRLALRATGARTFTDRRAKVWMRAYLRGGDRRRALLRERARQRLAARSGR